MEKENDVMGLRGKHCLVTGASGGIGIATVELLLSLGAKVTAQYNSNKETLKRWSELNAGSAERLNVLQCDVTNESAVQKLFEDSVSKFGHVDSLILNHGIFVTKDLSITEMSLDQFQNTINVNLTSNFLLSKQLLIQLQQRCNSVPDKKDFVALTAIRTNVVLVGSTSGLFGEAGHIDYSSSKSALMYGFAKTLKNEITKISPRSRVNTVAPGWVKTPMAEESLANKELVSKVLQTLALRKIATAQDVSNSIAFLASDKMSGHVSGDILEIHGGMEGRCLYNKEQVAEHALNV